MGLSSFLEDVGDDLGDLGSFLLHPDLSFLDAQQGLLTGNPLTPGGEAILNVGGGGLGGDSRATSNYHTVTAEPWAAIRPSLMRGIGTAQGVYYDDLGNLRRREYVGPGEVSRSALGRLNARSMADPLQSASESYLSDVLGGGVNPYLSRMYDQSADKIRSRLDSQFAASGRYGSDSHEREMGAALGDLATNLYGGQYQSDMARRMQAAQIAPGIGYEGINRQLQAGQYLDEIDRERANWDIDSQKQDLQDYIDQINSIGGAYPSQSSPIYRNKTAEALQLLTGGAGLIGNILKLGA